MTVEPAVLDNILTEDLCKWERYQKQVRILDKVQFIENQKIFALGPHLAPAILT